MTGTERAAVLLLSIGEQEAARVLKHLNARDIQVLGSAMAGLKAVQRDQAVRVLAQFEGELREQSTLGVETEDYVRKVLVDALGKDEANDLVDRIMLGRSGKGLEALKWMDSADIAAMIRQEHPQIIALVLAHLRSDQAAQVVGHLPENLRSDVLMRVATLSGVQPHALHELDAVMEGQFSGSAAKFRAAPIGGLKAAADILNNMETVDETTLLEGIRTENPDLGGKIEELMFTFADLVEVDDRSMQLLLKEISTNQLVIALKGCDAELCEKFYKNMSHRAAELLKEDMSASRPVRLSEVDAAQKEILAVARKLADAGTIALGGTEQMI
ncbi:MAG TPA: flagellar motor switch protein FliG [Rhodanobacteraceae bacterium]|nr:flagellar motor switch protein FliG [Rhodanobacteraceae bacterium]